MYISSLAYSLLFYYHFCAFLPHICGLWVSPLKSSSLLLINQWVDFLLLYHSSSATQGPSPLFHPCFLPMYFSKTAILAQLPACLPTSCLAIFFLVGAATWYLVGPTLYLIFFAFFSIFNIPYKGRWPSAPVLYTTSILGFSLLLFWLKRFQLLRAQS